MWKTLLAGVTAVLLAAPTAQAVTVGNDVIDRPAVDLYQNFAIALTDMVLPTGTITSVSNFGAVSGDISVLVFSGSGSGSGITLEAFIDHTAVAGSISTLTGLSVSVQAGWYLGLYQGAGRVDYSNNTLGADFFAPNDSGMLAIGDTLDVLGTVQRDYSLSVEVNAVNTVPLPAALPALGTGLVLMAMVRRRRPRS